MFHGSLVKISKVENKGLFGGVFATPEKSSCHDGIVYELFPKNILTDYALNYEIEGAWEIALEIAKGNEDVAEAIMDKCCDDCGIEPEDVGVDERYEVGYALQKMRGQIAYKLGGFDAVEMFDEHGTVYLCLAGCEIKEAQ